MKKVCTRVILPLLIAFITVSLLALTRSTDIITSASTLSDQKNQLSVLKDKYKDAANKTKSVKSNLAKTQGDIKTNLQKKDDLDAEIVALTEQIKTAELLIAEYETAISDKEAEKVALEKKKQEQHDTLGQMLKTSYMYGDESYIDLILGSGDIGDFLQRLDFISYHMKYSHTLIDEMEITSSTLDEVTASLEGSLEAMTELKSEYEITKAELEPKLAEVDDIIIQLQADEAYMASKLAQEEKDTAELEKDIKALEKQIAEKEAQLKKEEEEKARKEGGSSGSSSTDNSSVIWPIKNYRPVTSSYGYRKDPFTGKTAFHNGLDIAAPHGTNILAAKSGTVIRASKYSTYGECVILDHGGGMITLYAHCSGYNVKVGQKVNQGDVIAFVGSTGRSTGNHLHFVVRINGEYMDPNKYLP